MRDGGLQLLAFLFLATGSSAGAAPEPPAEDPSGWSVAVEREIADSEYRLTWQEETALTGIEAAWQAPNRAHDFRTYFTGDGIHVVPRSTHGASWEWGLSLVRVGRPGSAGLAEAARLSVAGPAAEYDRGSVVERYVNDRRGLAQLFEIEDAPGGSRGPVHLDLALSGTLSPVIAEDGQAIDFATPGGGRVLHYASLLVVDARGTVLPSWIEGLAEPGLSGIRLVYDDASAVYPVTVDPLTTSAMWSAEGDQGSAWFGNSVATAGDVNGDGYSDVLVGAPFFDAGENDEGRAYLYLGSPSGARTSYLWSVESDQPGASFGWSVGPAGDVNGDGYDDVIVGAFQHPNGGKAYVYLGSATGLDSTAVWTVEGGQGGAWLGHSVGTAGDVNGDGFADVIVGAGAYTNDQGNEGRAYVYHGSATGPAVSPSWTAEGDQVGAQLGWSVATAGDVNADGFADVIVGANGYDNFQTNEGRALVYHGSASGLAPNAAWAVESDAASSLFGSSVATAGDVNGDGYADVVVGAKDYDNGQTDEGRAVVYHGSATGLSTTVAWTQESDQAGARFGYAVAPAGDLNGDGFADVIVGANGYNGFGRTFVYLGSPSGLQASIAWLADSGQSGAGLQGISVSTAGDVNGDGFSDMIVGYSQYDNPEANEGRAFLYHGTASPLALPAAWTAEGDQGSTLFGSAVGTAGDVDGDGYSEVIVGAPNYDSGGQAYAGRAYVFRGSASGLAVTAAWILDGPRPGSAFGRSVASAGDVDGDGYSDVIVGADWYDNGQVGEGAALVYRGSATGLVTTPVWVVESDRANSYFGHASATAGDVNGDGYSDVIVGAYNDTNGQAREGRAYVFHGSAAGLATTAAWTAEIDQADALFGTAVGTAGDVDGDGYSDVIVGAGSFLDGRVYVYHGSAAGLATAPTWFAEGVQAQSGVGNAAATAGDVNGDGYSDVLVGATNYDGGETNEGRAYLYLGSSAGLGSIPAWTAEANQANAGFGQAVKSAGDVNADGYSDVIIGAPYYSNVEAAEGRAFVYLGSVTGLATLPAWTTESNQQGASLGQAVGAAGDVNGDGFSDVVVGAFLYDNGHTDEGGAFVHYGGGGDGLDRIPRQARSDDTAPIAVLGRSDSETEFRLQATGRSPAGRDRIRLEWQVLPLGAPFGGAGRETSPIADTGAPTLQGSAVSLSEPVTGLAEGAFYHWRSRIASANPYFPRSPWMSLAGNNGTETKLRTAGCLDGDGDGFGALADPSCSNVGIDCGETDAAVHPGAPEVNDGQDNECAGDPGHGVADEVVGTISLASDGTLCWTDSSGADGFEIARSTHPDFVPCEIILGAGSSGPCTSDPDTPPPGETFYYLVRATSPYVGSWGRDSNGLERTLACGVIESIDQRNLVPSTQLQIFQGQQLAQTIFVNVTGRLSGVEIAPVRQSLLPTDTILLDVYRGATLLATAALPAAGFPSNTPDPLDSQNGPGYVNLSPFDIAVQVGQTIKLVLRAGWSPDTCDGFFCAASGKACTGTSQCDRSAAAGVNINGYPSGTASINGTPVPNFDLVFKTLVLH